MKKNITVLSVIIFSLIFSAGCFSTRSENKGPYAEYLQFWDLETGSHIAYIHIAARQPSRSIPLIFLHGGPGACEVPSFGNEAPISWYENLARHDYDVYFYDQIGSGLSARLSDPSQYTVERHVRDLENIRRRIGDKPCILIGDSWGSTLAAHYMAQYPQNVKKAIFTSPGSIDIRDWNDEYSPVPRFPAWWYEWIGERYGEAALARYLELDKLMQTDIPRAYAFAGDAEMDILADEFISAVIFESCVYNKAFTKSAEFRMAGMGWWASIMTVWDFMRKAPIKTALRENTTPVLILHGEADYLHPGISTQYKDVFPFSKYVEVPKAGHFIWLDQPEIYRREIESFLLN